MGIVDIGAIVIILLGALIGFKKGAIKSLVQLIGLVAIVIVAYQFKGLLGNFFIKYLPFFNFGGALNELYAINILVYQGIAFVVIFVLLYCILNILINLSGILDLLVKMTIILELPSKIIGAILGAVEAIVFVFILAFALLQFGHTQKLVMESQYVLKIVERTPVVNEVFAKTIVASEEIYHSVKANQENGNMVEANLSIIRSLIKYGIVDAPVVQEAIDNGKLRMENVVVAS
ncbi:MAG: CvpA family protein [Bacilli bacterium]|nr:CvpA family protein [Bacilli bacterium]